MIYNINRLQVATAVALLGFVHAPMDEAVRLGVKRRTNAMDTDYTEALGLGRQQEHDGEHFHFTLGDFGDLMDIPGQSDPADTLAAEDVKPMVPAPAELQVPGQKRPRGIFEYETTDDEEDGEPIVNLYHNGALKLKLPRRSVMEVVGAETDDEGSEAEDSYNSGTDTAAASPGTPTESPIGRNSPSPVLTSQIVSDQHQGYAPDIAIDDKAASLNQAIDLNLISVDQLKRLVYGDTELLLTPEDVKFINEKSILPVGFSMQSKGKGRNKYLALRLTDMRFFWREIRENIAGYMADNMDHNDHYSTLKKLMEATNDPSWNQEMVATSEELTNQF